jgi:UDP-glucuronate decarboxylase
MKALMEVEENPRTPINLGNPGEFTINELAALIAKLTGTRSRIVYQPLPTDDPQRRRPDICRAREHLGWEPTIPLSEGLPPTIGWFAQTTAAVRAAPTRETPAGVLAPQTVQEA